MANEWTKVEAYGDNNDGRKIRFAIADNVSVSQGQLCALLDPRTASGATTVSCDTAFCGVAAEEKRAGIGVTDVSIWTDGIFEAVASGAIGIGNPVSGGCGNLVRIAPATASGAGIIGWALEAATDAETINIRLKI